ncbi:hypothetical protein, conserved [Eimeria maxima]|uniref:Uncharacterized protein n=1 Tax=Eimeria maxima TaxID=5804 RepID=U6LYY7_EIMMA|nr:hypothetical protein, conserved [Eimeria maxima]CDJ57167.1 hypothetical protein, conserved [Eimeria maxima]
MAPRMSIRLEQNRGYLYSRLLKLDDSSNDSSNSSSSESSSSKLPRFVTVSTWLTPQDYALAWSKAIVLGLPQQIPAGPPGGSPEGYLDGPPPAVLYKRVADDSEYSPTA